MLSFSFFLRFRFFRFYFFRWYSNFEIDFVSKIFVFFRSISYNRRKRRNFLNLSIELFRWWSCFFIKQFFECLSFFERKSIFMRFVFWNIRSIFVDIFHWFEFFKICAFERFHERFDFDFARWSCFLFIKCNFRKFEIHERRWNDILIISLFCLLLSFNRWIFQFFCQIIENIFDYWR